MTMICDFCRKTDSLDKEAVLVVGKNNVAICSKCIDLGSQIVKEHSKNKEEKT